MGRVAVLLVHCPFNYRNGTFLLDKGYDFLESLCELLEVFLVEENFMLVVGKAAVFLYSPLALKYVLFPARTGLEYTSSPLRSIAAALSMSSEYILNKFYKICTNIEFFLI